MELYIASFGHRYSDPMSSFIGFDKEKVEAARDAAIKYEYNEMPSYCEHDDRDTECQDENGNFDGVMRCNDDCEDCNGSTCSLCYPDLVHWGVWPVYHVKDIGGLRRTINYVKECRESENGVTSMEMS